MQLIINQQPCEFPSDALDVPTLLASRGVKQEAVALAVNGQVDGIVLIFDDWLRAMRIFHDKVMTLMRRQGIAFGRAG